MRNAKRKRIAHRDIATKLDTRSIEIVVSVDRALQLSKSVRMLIALMQGDAGFGPALTAALDKEAAELSVARQGLREIYRI